VALQSAEPTAELMSETAPPGVTIASNTGVSFQVYRAQC
jgi:hypothetical protein